MKSLVSLASSVALIVCVPVIVKSVTRIPALLLERLVELGCHIAYPRVAAKGQPLEFYRVPDGEVLAPGAFGIHEPLGS